MIRSTVRIRRELPITISAPLALLALAGFTTSCRRENPPPPPAPLTLAAPKALPPPDAQPSADARPLIDPTFLVLIWIDSTPPGAAVRRLSDGHVMGWTPDTMEFNQSATPVKLRFELEGYVPVTRDMPVLGDGELKVVLQPIPKRRTSATKKAKVGAHPVP